MTEYIVSNIETALAKKQFPMYKSVFDRFTRIYVESQKISVPMDILTMSLCECIAKNSDAIRYISEDTTLKMEKDEEKIPPIKEKKEAPQKQVTTETVPPLEISEPEIVQKEEEVIVEA